jgi:hypothetical protein
VIYLISIISWAWSQACAELVGNFKVSGIITGSIIGLTEWLILRRIFSNSYWWILALALSGLTVLGKMWLPPNLTVFDLTYRPLTFVPIGFFTSIVTGVTFIWLLRSPDAL